MKSFTQSYPLAFWKLCLACLLFFSSFTMVLPDLPILLEDLGGAEFKWLIIPSFAIIALFTRPFSGKLADKVGRVFVMSLGAIITSIACGLYIFIPFVGLFFAIRAFHGFCAGFTPTGFTAYADDIVPIEKRGEAMGIVGICNNIGNAIGWVFGSQCTQTFGLNTMFVIAASLGLISLWMFRGLKESIPNKSNFQWSMLKLKTDELLEKRVFLPGLILLLTAFASGSILSLIADFSSYIGVKNKGLYMAIYILSSLIIRFMAGRWSDIYGRKRISLYGAFSLFVSMMLLAHADSMLLYAGSSVLFGVGFGLISPSLFAWAVDISIPGYKGRAVGTLFIFLELGIILGSSIGGLIYNNQVENFQLAFTVSAILSLSAVVVLIFSSQKFKTFAKSK